MPYQTLPDARRSHPFRHPAAVILVGIYVLMCVHDHIRPGRKARCSDGEGSDQPASRGRLGLEPRGKYKEALVAAAAYFRAMGFGPELGRTLALM